MTGKEIEGNEGRGREEDEMKSKIRPRLRRR
jgi:hypothetical protein